jgi:hypothetical protein
LNAVGGTISVSSGEAPAAEAVSPGLRRREPGLPVEIGRERLEFGLVVVPSRVAVLDASRRSPVGG